MLKTCLTLLLIIMTQKEAIDFGSKDSKGFGPPSYVTDVKGKLLPESHVRKEGTLIKIIWERTEWDMQK